MKTPKNGFKVDASVFTWNGMWYGRVKRYGKERYLKSHNVRFDDTCGGTEEISFNEYHIAALKHAEIFN